MPTAGTMLASKSAASWKRAVPIIVVVVALGVLVVLVGRAAIAYAGFEAESGSLSGGASAVALAGASGGSVARFGSGSTSTPSPAPDLACTKTIGITDNIAASLTALVPGSVLCLHGGTYVQAVTASLPAGTASSPITVRAYTGEKPVIKGLVRLTSPINYVFDGINVTWPDTGATSSDHMLKITNGSNWVWKNSEVWGAHSFADILVASTVAGQPSNWKLTNNCIHDTYATNATNQDHNIYVNTDNSAGSGIIERNIFYNAVNGENIKLAGPSTGTGTSNVTVRYNTLYNASQNILVGWTSSNNIFANNLLYMSGSNVGIRGYYLADGTINTASNNYVGGTSRFIVSDSGYGVVNDGGGNIFPAADPVFDKTVCTVDKGLMTGFKPQNSAAAHAGYWGN